MITKKLAIIVKSLSGTSISVITCILLLGATIPLYAAGNCPWEAGVLEREEEACPLSCTRTKWTYSGFACAVECSQMYFAPTATYCSTSYSVNVLKTVQKFHCDGVVYNPGPANCDWLSPYDGLPDEEVILNQPLIVTVDC